MTKLFEQKVDFPYLQWGMGFIIGCMLILLISMFIPDPEPKIIKVRVVQYVEKPVVVRKPVYLNRFDKQQIQCLAENAYFEAGNQSKKGMIAVTNVVMNRVKDKRFPGTPCAVVNQKARGVCQFSWVCEGGKTIRDWTQYRQARNVAEQVYLRNVRDVTGGAKFYHADYVSPSWGRVFDRTTKIGAHIFYRG
jgi:spore germination cell wall hydrolase CwlJ-like protein